MSWWVSLADTVVAMPLVMLVGAVAVIVLLMVVGMRQRWEPEIPPTFGTGLQPPPPPRFYGVLAIVGISLVVMGGCLGALLHSPGLIFVGLAAYTATWIVRHILLFWEEARIGGCEQRQLLGRCPSSLESPCLLLPDLYGGSSGVRRYTWESGQSRDTLRGGAENEQTWAGSAETLSWSLRRRRPPLRSHQNPDHPRLEHRGVRGCTRQPATNLRSESDCASDLQFLGGR